MSDRYQQLVNTPIGRIGLEICFDSCYTGVTRRLAADATVPGPLQTLASLLQKVGEAKRRLKQLPQARPQVDSPQELLDLLKKSEEGSLEYAAAWHGPISRQCPGSAR